MMFSVHLIQQQSANTHPQQQQHFMLPSFLHLQFFSELIMQSRASPEKLVAPGHRESWGWILECVVYLLSYLPQIIVSHRLLLEPGTSHIYLFLSNNSQIISGGLDSHPRWESLQKYGRQLPWLTTLRRSRSCLTLCQAVLTSEECQDTRSTAVVSPPWLVSRLVWRR